jgi:D-beta-D-heptose 7-phosphate kinase/D-beta-D-heptose 1-phosphate adenosyltransferase
MKKVLVIGDGCKDVFQYGKCDRLSPEAPVPVFKPTKTTSNGGMAVNVYNNLKALDIDCDIITYSGTTKTRYVDEVSNQMLLRIDENDIIKPLNIEDVYNIKFSNYSAIVISDYNKGLLSEEAINFISRQHKLVFVDTKKKIGRWALDVKYLKINEKEFKQNLNFLIGEITNDIVVTLGKTGAVLFHNNDGVVEEKFFPIENEHNIRDLSGAGDTFLAGLVADYLNNSDISSAIKFANRCASWVVTQKGVVSVDKTKI